MPSSLETPPPPKGGLATFIEKKKIFQKEREGQPPLKTYEKLIGFDGPDGIGKTTIVARVFEKLKEKYGSDNVVLVTGKNPQPKAEKIGKINDRLDRAAVSFRRSFSAGFERKYEETIIPALGEGRIVLLESTELRLLIRAKTRGDEADLQERLEYIRNGTATHGILPGKRIIFEGRTKDIFQNLTARALNTPNDPTTLEEVKKALDAQRESEALRRTISHSGESTFFHKQVERVEDEEQRQKYIDQLADEIIKDLGL